MALADCSWEHIQAMRLDLGSAIMCAHSPCSRSPLPSQPWAAQSRPPTGDVGPTAYSYPPPMHS